MKFKELQYGDSFTVVDEDNVNDFTVFVKTVDLMDEIIHGNCIIVYSNDDKVSVHKGELAWFSDNTDVSRLTAIWGCV